METLTEKIFLQEIISIELERSSVDWEGILEKSVFLSKKMNETDKEFYLFSAVHCFAKIKLNLGGSILEAQNLVGKAKLADHRTQKYQAVLNKLINLLYILECKDLQNS